MRKLMQPLFDSSIVTEGLGKYSIEDKKDVQPALFPKALVRAETITTLLGKGTIVQITLEKDNGAQANTGNANGSMLPYGQFLN